MAAAPLTPQSELVLEYLNANPGKKITPRDAMVFLGINSLTVRIAELRRHKVEIAGEWVVDEFNRRYKAYWLGKGAE
jgi:hypothetical protein